jgi:sugar phosphate isomerase/epimerase
MGFAFLHGILSDARLCDHSRAEDRKLPARVKVNCRNIQPAFRNGKHEKMNSVACNKRLFPFRLGCTSYVYPDDIVPNVEKTAPLVDDIELVLFESGYDSNLPGKEVVGRLKELQDRYGITYTVHFPIDKKAGSTDRSERRDFCAQAEKIIWLTLPLRPYAYILHFEGIKRDASSREREAWTSACDEVSRSILDSGIVAPEKICVENLDYPVSWHEEIVSNSGFSYCLDIGHLWLYGEPWRDIVKKYLDKTRVIHAHGVSDGKDHQSLALHRRSEVVEFVETICDSYKNVVTLELFAEKDFFSSLELVGEIYPASLSRLMAREQ